MIAHLEHNLFCGDICVALMNLFKKSPVWTWWSLIWRIFWVSLVTLLLVGFTLVWQLRQGISWAELSFTTMQAKDIHLRWQHGLVVSAQEVVIHPGTSGYRPGTMAKFLRILRLAEQVIVKVDIAQFKINGGATALHYQAGENKVTQFSFQTSDVTGVGTVRQEIDQIRFHIKSLSSQHYKSVVAGEIIFWPQQEKITGKLTGMIANCLPLAFTFKADRQGLSLQAEQQGEVVTITPLLDLLALPSDLRPWLVDRLQANSFRLSRLQGSFDWQHPARMLKNLRATISIKETRYRFNPELPPISSPLTVLDWRHGRLTIKPQGAIFAGHNLGNSTASLDFSTPKSPVLQINLQTKTRLAKELLAVSDQYGINLPFTQQQGETSIDLQLTIPLTKPGLQAQGTFLVTDGIFQAAKSTYNIDRADISLHDNEVTINHLAGQYGKDMALTIQGKIMASQPPRFHLVGQIQHWHPQWSGPEINLKEPLTLQVNQDNRGVILKLGQGHFMVADTALTSAPVVLSLAAKTNQLNFAKFTIEQEDKKGLKAQVSGMVNIQSLLGHFTVALAGGPLNNTSAMANKPLVFQVDYDKKLTVSLAAAHWRINHRMVTLSKSQLVSDGKYIDLTAQDLTIPGVLTGNIRIFYRISQQQGDLDLSAIVLPPPLSAWFKVPAKTTFQIEHDPQKIMVRLNQPRLSLKLGLDHNWRLTLLDLGHDKALFPLLRPLALRAGTLAVFPDSASAGWHWQGRVNTDLQILWQDDKPLQKWPLTGTINGDGLTLSLADLLTIKAAANQVKVQSHDLGFSLPDLLPLLLPEKGEEVAGKTVSTTLPIISLTAKDSFIILAKNRRLSVDKLRVNWGNDRLVAQLQHGQGLIDFTSQGDEFSLKGEALRPVLLGELLNDAQFDGGVFNILAGGNFHHYNLAFDLQNSHLKDFTLLNNIMAFIDTVPSLLTFSMPGYTVRGMDIIQAEGALTIADQLVQVDSFSLQSSTLTMTATGNIDLGKQRLDLALDMISPARDNLAKIPLAGRLFQDNKRMVGITLAAKGDLAHPQVTPAIFRGIPAKGFDILKQTLHLPLDIVEGVFDK